MPRYKVVSNDNSSKREAKSAATQLPCPPPKWPLECLGPQAQRIAKEEILAPELLS